MPETVLVLGSTGNIGTVAIYGALAAGCAVLAVVRDSESAMKLRDNVGYSSRITAVEASVVDEGGVDTVIEKVRQGILTAFQHVFSAIGGGYTETSMQSFSTKDLQYFMRVNFESSLPAIVAYRATVPYCLCVDNLYGLPRRAWLSSSPCISARSELDGTNVRFNEIYLNTRVEVDKAAEEHGVLEASTFGRVCESILEIVELRSSRVRVSNERDVDTLNIEKQLGRGV